MNDAKKYLLNKVRKTHVGHRNANTGARLLKLYPGYEDEIDIMLLIVIEVLNHFFRNDRGNNKIGEGNLTNVSITIGKYMYRHMRRQPVTYADQIYLGDLFIEAMYNCGYIDLNYPKLRNSCHIVKHTSKWFTIGEYIKKNAKYSIRATTLYKPEDSMPFLKNGLEHNKLTYNAVVVASSNKLQQEAWRINYPVLKALKAVKGFIPTDKEKDEDHEKKRQSKLIEWNFIESKAEYLAGKDYYQMVSLDYRGRTYYDEAFLNYQGSDLVRGMLLFAEGKPLKKKDSVWLAIHTACSYNKSYHIDEIPDWCEADYVSYLQEEGLDSISVDKMTLEDRAAWTRENLNEILDLGESNAFDESAEKPVSFLACCIEWFNYNEAVGKGEEFISHLPIPIDGSNNGWQHLGAISKDTQTGELVGLVPTDIQKDFYVETAKELIRLTKDERLISILDRMPMKHIRKGISKRGSMTKAYSAGAGKIAENMWQDCKSEGYDKEYGITEEDCKKFAKSLVTAIETVCPGPLQTMKYLQGLTQFELGQNAINKEDIARRKELKKQSYISTLTEEELNELNDLNKLINAQANYIVYGNGSKYISWETPSGFPVEYKAWNTVKSRVKGTISGYRRVTHVLQLPSTSPNMRDFIKGIAPNYIHSMDAAHMALVINDWKHSIAVVHDSFATHACDVEDLLHLTKEKFIHLYDVDNYFDHIENQLITDKKKLDVKQPEQGDLDITDIYDSNYFFS